MGWLAVALGVAAAVCIPFLPVLSLILFVTAVAVALFIEVRVTIDADAVRVRGPLYGFPRVTFPLTRIAGASAIDVRPLKHGGWGYRGSLTLFRRAAWILRAGPGLQLDLRGGRRFVVTIDDAEGAAAAINRRDQAGG